MVVGSYLTTLAAARERRMQRRRHRAWLERLLTVLGRRDTVGDHIYLAGGASAIQLG